MLKEVLPIACQTVAYLPGFSLISLENLEFSTHSENIKNISFLMLSILPTWSWITIPVHFRLCLPHCQLLSWRKTTQLSSCDVKCNSEPSLDWCIFSFGAPLIEVGLNTSVSVNSSHIFLTFGMACILKNKKRTWYSRGYLQADKIKSWNSFLSFGKCLGCMLRGKGVVGPVLWSNSLEMKFPS